VLQQGETILLRIRVHVTLFALKN